MTEPSRTEPTRQETLVALLHALRRQERDLVASAEIARDEATSQETKSEGKYDTRAIEAGYLAGAQSQRAAGMARVIAAFERVLNEAPVVGEIRKPCLVGLESATGERRWYFLGPAQGGLAVEIHGVTVRVLTPDAPLGRSLVGLGVGDELAGAQGERLHVVAIDNDR